MCSNCKSWHGVPPLEFISKEDPCPFKMGKSCICCSNTITALSTGGDNICGYCDSGACHKYGHSNEALLKLQTEIYFNTEKIYNKDIK